MGSPRGTPLGAPSRADSPGGSPIGAGQALVSPPTRAGDDVVHSTSSKLCSVLTGGLNTQALRHSLPYVSSYHYADLYPEFAAICQKHGVVLSSACAAPSSTQL